MWLAPSTVTSGRGACSLIAHPTPDSQSRGPTYLSRVGRRRRQVQKAVERGGGDVERELVRLHDVASMREARAEFVAPQLLRREMRFPRRVARAARLEERRHDAAYS